MQTSQVAGYRSRARSLLGRTVVPPVSLRGARLDESAVMPRSHMPIVIHAKAADPKIWELLSKGGASSPPWTGEGPAPPRTLEVETGCRLERPRRAICGTGIVDRAEKHCAEDLV